jgi:hypothetical protein
MGENDMPPRDYFLAATIDEVVTLFGELQNASDRVSAISAAAFLDDTLGAALLARFVRVGTTWKDRMFSTPNAPFSSFYSKSVAGFAMGLFGPLTYADLTNVRRIRNEFAHTATPLHFSDPNIASHCEALTTPSRVNMGLGTPFPLETGPKVQYARTVYGIAITLIGQTRSAVTRPSFPDALP